MLYRVSTYIISSYTPCVYINLSKCNYTTSTGHFFLLLVKHIPPSLFVHVIFPWRLAHDQQTCALRDQNELYVAVNWCPHALTWNRSWIIRKLSMLKPMPFMKYFQTWLQVAWQHNCSQSEPMLFLYELSFGPFPVLHLRVGFISQIVAWSEYHLLIIQNQCIMYFLWWLMALILFFGYLSSVPKQN